MKSLLSFVLCLGLLLAGLARAQFVDPVRPIPADALKAEMVVQNERTITLNGMEFRLAAGGQILNKQNMIALTQSLLGDKYVVRVKFNQQREAQRVWILTAAEDAVDAPKLKTDTPWWRLF